jgi:hypothetical protein
MPLTMQIENLINALMPVIVKFLVRTTFVIYVHVLQ